MLCCLTAALLLLPALRADDKPKEDKPKEEKKDQSPREQFQALVREFNQARSKMIPEINKAKGKEQQELIQKYYGLGKEFAERVYKIAEDNAKDPVAADAIFWVLDNGGDSDYQKKAADKAKAIIAEMPLADLVAKLRMTRAQNLLQLVFDRAEKESKDEKAADLLVWVAQNGFYMPVGEKAIDRLVRDFPENPAIERICSLLARGGGDKSAVLKQIMERAKKPSVKAAAALALGQSLANKADRLGDKQEEADKVAAEAEKYFTMVIDEFGKDNANLKKSAEKELHILRTLRIGKEVPEIKGVDLDEKEFKLSDYRGKVVLIDFWGNW
jgi:hypothetical protein